MHKDEIIAEVWRNRDAYAEKHNYDLHEMVADLQMRPKKRECNLVDRRDRTNKDRVAQNDELQGIMRRTE